MKLASDGPSHGFILGDELGSASNTDWVQSIRLQAYSGCPALLLIPVVARQSSMLMPPVKDEEEVK